MRPRRLLHTLRADLRTDTERGRLVRSTGVTAGLKVGATLIAFGASLVYARALGPHDYGLYAYVIAWAALLTIPAGLGVPAYLVREGAKAPAALRPLRRWADVRLLAGGLVAGLLLASAVFLPQAAAARWLFVVAAPLPLLNNLGNVRASLLQARGWIARSQWPRLILGPAIMLAVLAGLWVWRGRLHPLELVAVMVGAACMVLAVNQLQLRRAATPKASGEKPASVRIRAALPFMWLGGLYLLNNRVDLIILGSLRGAEDAGIYAVAARAAALVPFISAAAAMALAPRIARLYAARDHDRLQRMITAAARRIFITSAPFAILLIVAAWWLLYYFFGARYTPAALALRILAGSQLVVLAIGSVGTILNMAGHERRSMVGLSMAVVLNIVLNLILIPRFGPEGAAIASGTSLIFAQLLLWYWIRRHLRLRPSAFGL